MLLVHESRRLRSAAAVTVRALFCGVVVRILHDAGAGYSSCWWLSSLCTPPGFDNRALSAVRAVHPEQGVPGPKLCEGLPVSHTGSVPRYRGFGCGQEVCVCGILVGSAGVNQS